MDRKIVLLIAAWKQKVDEHQKANYELAVKYNKYHYAIGLSATIFAMIAGVILIAEVEDPRIRITIGVFGVIAALLSAVQTFYSHTRRAEDHQFMVSQLALIRRDIEIFENYVPENESEREQRIREINQRIADVEEVELEIEGVPSTRKWPWFLLGFTGATALILLLVLGLVTLERVPSIQTSTFDWVSESVQQGTETWQFDPLDPLVEQRIILVNTWINEITTQKIVTLLAYLNEIDNQEPITIYLSSRGGYTKDAYAIAHAIQESASPVDTVAIGDCFSACVKVLMSGTGSRKIAPNSRIAIHTHSYPYDGDPYSINTILYERERIFFRDHSEIPLDWIDREEKFFYLSPEQAIEYQLVDEILE